jgi:membrane carboxypeptidase/penicillin-binding protein PbpC
VSGREYEVRVAESWPAELAAWLQRHGQAGDPMPPHDPRCGGADARDDPPRVLSPASGQTYMLLPDAAPQRLPLKAASRAAALYWFVDGSLVATSAPLDAAYWPLERGPHTITCADDAGRSASLAITVR